MKTGDICHGFVVEDVRQLAELGGKGVFARHVKTGLEVFHLVTDDEENLFAYAFMTPPSDSTGVAHILEHSVLCGSENYPLKDPFLVLNKQSVKTFLNAMTFPDKTVYPASSMVEADYFNLMSVYGDAVFFPLLDEWIFRQEGHRFEIGSDGTVSIQGVVFNEMRGNYSSFDSIAGDWSLVSLLEGTPYAHDSGGNPADIPALTYEQFKAFHKTYYHPVNCRVFLSGNIATERQLELLETRFLSRFESAAKPLPLTPVVPYAKPKEYTVSAPAGEGQDPSLVTVMINWLLSDSTDTVRLMEANLIAEILLGHDGAPLSRALLESGLGQDLAPSSGLETEIRHMCFCAGLRGVEKKRTGEFSGLVRSVLETLATGGIDAEAVETAIRTIDFSNREIRRSGGPFALSLMRRSLRGWIHGKGPFDTLRYVPAFEEVKRRVAASNDYLPSLIRAWFLDNPHSATVTVCPDPDYEKRLDEQLASRIRLFEKSLTPENRTDFLREQDAFFALQKKEDSEEILARIPHLSVSELPVMAEITPWTVEVLGSVPVVFHEQPTNGIAYADFAIPVDLFSPEEYLLLPLFSSVLTGMGLGSLGWVETSALSARVTGGLGTMLFSSSSVPGEKTLMPCPPSLGRDVLMIRVKMLSELVKEAVDLCFGFLSSADFSDSKRLTDIILEYKNDLDSSLAPAGNHYALSRAASFYGKSKAVDEIWNGLTQVRFIRELSQKIKKKGGVENLSARLEGIRVKLLSAGMIAHCTGTADILKNLTDVLTPHLSLFTAPLLPPEGADIALAADPALSAYVNLPSAGVSSRECITAPLQVGFASAVLPSPGYDHPDQAADIVFGHWMSSGPLWERIRTKGGAYGAFSYPDALERVFVFSTYRDPFPLQSLEVFRSALEDAARNPVSGASLEKTITGCYSREVQPRSPSDKGFTSFIRLLFGISDEARKRKITRLLSVSESDMKNVAERLLSDWPRVRQAVLAGKKMLKDREKTDFTGNTVVTAV